MSTGGVGSVPVTFADVHNVTYKPYLWLKAKVKDKGIQFHNSITNCND
jgi:hypothetical protein